MPTYKCTEIQTREPRIWPWKAHGNIIKLNFNSVTEILYIDGAIVVTDMRDDVPRLTLVHNWEYASILEEIKFECEHCGSRFNNSQGLGMHTKVCGTKSKKDV
jgi:hypothetical protein